MCQQLDMYNNNSNTVSMPCMYVYMRVSDNTKQRAKRVDHSTQKIEMVLVHRPLAMTAVLLPFDLGHIYFWFNIPWYFVVCFLCLSLYVQYISISRFLVKRSVDALQLMLKVIPCSDHQASRVYYITYAYIYIFIPAPSHSIVRPWSRNC